MTEIMNKEMAQAIFFVIFHFSAHDMCMRKKGRRYIELDPLAPYVEDEEEEKTFNKLDILSLK